MITADWVALVLILLFLVFGLISGFAGGVRFLTKGVFGVIISVVVCYFIFGWVASLGFVQELLGKLNSAIAGGAESGFRYVLAYSIHIDYVILAIVLFIVVSILRVLLVKLFCGIMESSNVVIKIVNKVFGVVLWLAILAMLVLLAMQIVTWIGGSSYDSVADWLSGSTLKLDVLLEKNPLAAMVTALKGA